jgi:hypothetical protein
MPKRKTDGFRFNAKKVGLTFSCPVSLPENPIPSAVALRDALLSKVGFAKYIVAQEDHESGKKHYHVYLHCDVLWIALTALRPPRALVKARLRAAA